MSDRLTLIARCWIWTRRDPTTGSVQRGVTFHEPEASRALVDVEEFVPASQLAGAVEDRDYYRYALLALLPTKPGSADLAGVTDDEWIERHCGER